MLNVKYISTNKGLSEAVKHCLTFSILSIDVETCASKKSLSNNWKDGGLDPYLSDIVLVQLGTDKCIYVINPTSISNMYLLNEITSNKKILKVGVNLKFDIKQLSYHYGLEWSNISDCMINEMIRYQGYQRTKKYSMEAMTRRYLRVKYQKLTENLTGLKLDKDIRLTYNLHTPLSFEQIYYAAVDIYIAYKIYLAQSKWLWKPQYKLSSKIENKFTIVLANIELEGIPFSIPYWLDNEAKYAAELKKIEESLRETLRKEFPDFEKINLNSSKQVAALFREMKVPVDFVDKHGVETTSVSEDHIKNHSDIHPFISKYIEYKHAHKLVSTYGKKFLKYVHPITGRIHSDYYQILATGRISSSSPNLLLWAVV